MATTEIWLVRHGQSVSNLEGVWQGQGDSPLSDEGRKQAARLGRRLGLLSFDAVIASPLSRARDTALAVHDDLVMDPAFKEINVGRWEGMTRGEVATEFPEEVLKLKDGDRTIAVGGGESWNDLSARVGAALGKVRERGPGRYLVVCHGGVIFTLLRDLLALSQETRPLSSLRNTSVTRLRFDGDQMSLLAFNDDRHNPRTAIDTPRLSTLVAGLTTEPRGDEDGEPAGRGRSSAAQELARTADWLSDFSHPATALQHTEDQAARDGAVVLSEQLGLPVPEKPLPLTRALSSLLPPALAVASSEEIQSAVLDLLKRTDGVSMPKSGSVTEFLFYSGTHLLHSFAMSDLSLPQSLPLSEGP